MTVNGFVSLATWDYFRNRSTENLYSDEYPSPRFVVRQSNEMNLVPPGPQSSGGMGRCQGSGPRDRRNILIVTR